MIFSHQKVFDRKKRFMFKKKFNKIHDEISLTKSPKSSTTARKPSCRKHESRASATAQARNEKKKQ